MFEQSWLLHGPVSHAACSFKKGWFMAMGLTPSIIGTDQRLWWQGMWSDWQWCSVCVAAVSARTWYPLWGKKLVTLACGCHTVCMPHIKSGEKQVWNKRLYAVIYSKFICWVSLVWAFFSVCTVFGNFLWLVCPARLISTTTRTQPILSMDWTSHRVQAVHHGFSAAKTICAFLDDSRENMGQLHPSAAFQKVMILGIN